MFFWQAIVSLLFIWILICPAAAESVLIQAVGDLNLGARANQYIGEHEKNPDYFFKAIRSELEKGDINFVNLEAPFTDGSEPFKKAWNFRVPPQYLVSVRNAGFNLFSLANNHILDYGPQGLFETMALIKKYDAVFAGAGRNIAEARQVAVKEVNGKKVALLAYSLTFPKEFWADEKRPGNPFGHEKYIREDVKQARSLADIVLVSFHWGAELRHTPKPYQIDLAHTAIDMGADIIFGHHPHILQAVELYKGKPIFYSLGNFIFGSYSVSAKRSMMARIRVDNDGQIGEVMLLPLNVNNFEVDFQTRIAQGLLGNSILKEVEALSTMFGTRLTTEDGVGIV